MFSDPGNMLQWLQDELNDLEKNGELAIILSHVPNDDGCMRMLGKRLHAVFDRYQKTIRWIMYGHNHEEGFAVQTSMLEKKPIGLTF